MIARLTTNRHEWGGFHAEARRRGGGGGMEGDWAVGV